MCPLCGDTGPAGYFIEAERSFLRCDACGLVFLDSNLLPNPMDELERYKLHRNHPGDDGYVAFLENIIDSFSGRLSPGASGLDFGSGPRPVLADLLRARGFPVRIYDPFFANDPAALDRSYDFITCVETAEHFHRPFFEFERMDRLLDPGGIICLSTGILTDGTDFKTWHYRRDFTHVAFYSPKTLDWIARRFGWRMEMAGKKVVVFQKS